MARGLQAVGRQSWAAELGVTVAAK